MSKTQKMATTFGTAYDLPQVHELVREIRALETLKHALTSDQRTELSQQNKALRNMVQIVDSFYELLGPRNWVFHGDMNLKRVQEVLQAEDVKSAEEQFIMYYQDKDATKFLFIRLFRVEAFRPRMHIISRAYEDFLAERYYACVLALIPVLDGVVNDVEKAKRRGLHARAPEEMVAWDSVTAHHHGLKHAQATFTKTFRKTEETEVFELYRHGIVHGMVLNFNNEVVAAKALNQIFAIADWAETISKPPQQQEPLPTFAELHAAMKDSARANEISETFEKREYVPDQHEFSDYEIVVITHDFLEAWRTQNYGQLAKVFPKFPNESHGKRAGAAKNLYRGYQLTEYAVSKVIEAGSILSTVEVQAKINGTENSFTLRWVQMDDSGQPVLPGKPGEWTLAPFGPTTFLTVHKNAT